MTFRLSDEERGVILRTVKARLDALHTEMTRTDTPEFNIQLKHEEEIIRALIERLDSAASPGRRARSAGRGRRGTTGKRRRR
jgi:hypothetical protein